MSSHKMVNQKRIAVWWIPEAGLLDGANPKATEINAGTRISPALNTGYTLKMSDSSTDNSRTVEDEGNVETPTLKNYEGKLQFFRDEIGTGTQDAPVPATVFTTVLDLFKVPYITGWLVSRYGPKADAAVVAGDIVSTFKFKNDQYRTIEGDAGETPVLIEVEFLKAGEAYPNVTVVA